MMPITRVTHTFSPLPIDRLQMLAGWATVRRSAAYVWQVESMPEIAAVLELARKTGRTVAPRGAGLSYADAALNAEEIVLDLSPMRRVLAWDPVGGSITVEPGVTVRQLWQTVLSDGWWPPVVPGTMGPSMGGALAMNVHGKNAWRAGSIGEYVLAFDLLTADGTIRTVTPERDPELFHAAIGGLGMLGIMTSVTLQMRRIHAGALRVRQRVAATMPEMFAIFAEEAPTADYLVGWIDGFAAGASLGRGLVELAEFVGVADPRLLQPAAQDLPPKIAGLLPRAELWRAMKPVFSDPGMRLANAAQFHKGALATGAHLVPHAQFHFLHDYLPNWQRAWLPGGLRQFQAFVPAHAASAVFADLLRRSQHARLHPYLSVFKQHRADAFLLSYQVDGFSLSLDYHVTARNAVRLDRLLAEMQAEVAACGGRLYLAKDDALDAATYAHMVGPERVARFLALKRQLDPAGVFSSDLFRRVFG